jgi:hypothetical protein
MYRHLAHEEIDVHAERELERLAEAGRRAADARNQARQHAANAARRRALAREHKAAAQARGVAKRRANRSLTGWAWGASWTPFVYVFFPINPGFFLGGGGAVLAGWLSGWNGGLMVLFGALGVLWAPLAWLFGTAAGALARRRELKRLAALHYHVDGQLEVLGEYRPERYELVLTFTRRAPRLELVAALLARIGLDRRVAQSGPNTLVLELGKPDKRVFEHDNRRYHRLFWSLQRQVLAKLHEIYAITAVRVGCNAHPAR